jgi:Papain-like cysteine protease AvrRpt2
MTVERQQQTNWCWAATSKSVSEHYGSTAWTQCLIANQALPRTDCCAGGASDPARCNQPWFFDTALTVTANLAAMQSRALGFAEVQQEIGNDAPVGARVGWHGGGGHFMAITGWLVGESGDEYIAVSDPIYGETQILFGDYADAYQSGGDWTHSYLTHPPPALGGFVGAAAMGPPPVQDPAAIGA